MISIVLMICDVFIVCLIKDTIVVNKLNDVYLNSVHNHNKW